jgi:hypothetical protein
MAATKRKPTDYALLSVRTREALRARLEQEAKKNNRSLNSEIVERLERSLNAQDQRAGLWEFLKDSLGSQGIRLFQHIMSILIQTRGWHDNPNKAETMRTAINYIICVHAGLPLILPLSDAAGEGRDLACFIATESGMPWPPKMTPAEHSIEGE